MTTETYAAMSAASTTLTLLRARMDRQAADIVAARTIRNQNPSTLNESVLAEAQRAMGVTLAHVILAEDAFRLAYVEHQNAVATEAVVA